MGIVLLIGHIQRDTDSVYRTVNLSRELRRVIFGVDGCYRGMKVAATHIQQPHASAPLSHRSRIRPPRLVLPAHGRWVASPGRADPAPAYARALCGLQKPRPRNTKMGNGGGQASAGGFGESSWFGRYARPLRRTDGPSPVGKVAAR